MLPENARPKTKEIFAAQKIIADISSGLYRTPAAALKELITNAYDADATTVAVETDAPGFRTLVVRDNGSGMSVDKFLEVMNHIGGSRKRIVGGETTPLFGRRIIGRIGIGMLAVAQLGYRFYVSSSVKGDPRRFIAEVDLEPFHKDDAALISMGRMSDDSDEVVIGAVRYVDDLAEAADVHYTVITIPDVRQGMASEIANAVREAVGAKERMSLRENPAKSFMEILEVTRSAKRADTDLDGYYYTLWELGQLCPVNYVDDGPFRAAERDIDGIASINLPVVENFSLNVDGLEIRRPQLFPSRVALNYSSPAPKLYPVSFDRKVAGRHLRFSGYVYSQQPRVDPEDLRGIHIRIRDVGIGTYDRTWLGYPFDEGIKFGQLSGEIFVHDGLEQALNIDRDSFNETDVHYQALRAYIWDKLRKEIFPDFKVRQKTYTKGRKARQSTEYGRRFSDALAELPAPILIERAEYAPVRTPVVSNWIGFTDDSMQIERSVWKSFTSDTELTATDAQERFRRVIRVLVSNGLLVDMTNEEVEPLMRALSIAVQ
jgi:hypothetical protein